MTIMNFEYLKNRSGLISILLLCIAVFFVVLALVDIAAVFVDSFRWGALMSRAVAQSSIDANDAKRYFEEAKVLGDELKKQNLFSPPEPKKHPVNEVSGILGSEVLISGKWYKAGERVGDANIVSIEPTRVKVVWQGKEKYFSPIAASSNGVSVNGRRSNNVKKRNRLNGKAEPVMKNTPKESAVKVVEAEDPLAWLGVKLTAKAREMFLKRWNSMSDEEKEKAKEQWNKLSQEQKQQIADRMNSQG